MKKAVPILMISHHQIKEICETLDNVNHPYIKLEKV
jgi:hypothetical protein